MKTTKAILFALAVALGISVTVLLGVRATSQRSMPEAQKLSSTPRSAVGQKTEIDPRIASAEAMIERRPDSPDAYNRLAVAYLQKSRETDDSSFNPKAERAVERALELEPENFDGLSLRASLLLANHNFGEALNVARRAQKMRPDNSAIYGAITDALVELGDYRGAVEAAQRMVDLRPGTPAFARISYLRALNGDTRGAIQAMRLAVDSADARNPESVAWCRVQLGKLLMSAANFDEGEREYAAALAILPDFNHAVEAQARASVRAGDYERAIRLYESVQKRGSHADVAIALGDLYTRLGRTQEANQKYQLAEQAMTAGEGDEPRNTALFWADQDRRLDEALNIARQERGRRSDIYTSDVLAWCLFKKGMLTEAKNEIEMALRLGTKDANITYHAGMIYHALGARRKAANHLRRALEVDPSFHVLHADTARSILASLNVSAPARSSASLMRRTEGS